MFGRVFVGGFVPTLPSAMRAQICFEFSDPAGESGVGAVGAGRDARKPSAASPTATCWPTTHH